MNMGSIIALIKSLGGGGGKSSADVFIIHATPGETYTNAQLDKTAEQIYEAYKSGKYCLVCLDDEFVPVKSVETDGARYQMRCYGFTFTKSGQGMAVGLEFRTNDGVTWETRNVPPMLYNVLFDGLQIYSGGNMYTISVDADGNLTATKVT